MKRLLLWFVLLNKRLYKKITYLGILLLIPVLVFVFNMAAQEPSGIVTVAIGCEDPEDAVAVELVEQLQDEAIVISFRQQTPEQALEQVKAGKADGAWIFPSNMEEKIKLFITDKEQYGGFIQIVEREQTVALRLAREKLSAAIFQRMAKQLYLDYARENLSETTDITDEELLSYLERTGVTGELFAFYDIYGNAREDSGNYLTAPLRGMLAILATISAVVTAMYYQRDERRGIFALMPERHRIFGELGYQLISAINILFFVVIALIFSGLNVKLWHELALFVLYGLCCSLFGMAIRTLFGGGRLLAVLIPILSLVMLVVCPVFFNIGAIAKLQLLFPPTYYITGAYNYNYLWYMALYSMAMAVICLVGRYIRLRLPGIFRKGACQSKGV